MEMEINQSCNYWIFSLSVNVPVIFSVDQLIILTIKCQETEKHRSQFPETRADAAELFVEDTKCI